MLVNDLNKQLINSSTCVHPTNLLNLLLFGKSDLDVSFNKIIVDETILFFRKYERVVD